jgi:hypothetical protein
MFHCGSICGTHNEPYFLPSTSDEATLTVIVCRKKQEIISKHRLPALELNKKQCKMFNTTHYGILWVTKSKINAKPSVSNITDFALKV